MFLMHYTGCLRAEPADWCSSDSDISRGDNQRYVCCM